MEDSKNRDLLSVYLRASREVSRRFRKHYGRSNLTFPQVMALTLLQNDGPMTISTLAEMTDSANSTTSGVVDRLERMGFARRVRSDTDRRVIYVEVTDKWRELMNTTMTGAGDLFENMLAELSAEQRDQIVDSLILLADTLAKGDD